ncbi:MAG: MFS transporter [Dehalococcoidia bacterium]
MNKPLPFGAEKSRIFYGWWIVAAGCINQGLITLTIGRAFGSYAVLLENDFGWSKTALSGAYSLQQVESGLLGPVQGTLIDRFGPKASMRFGILLFGLGFIAFSQINTLTMFYVCYLMLAIGSSLGGFFPVNVVIANWFHRQRARAFSISQLGGAIGGLLIPIVAIMLETLGWRTTALISGVVILCVGLPINEVIRRRPEDHGLQVDGLPPAPEIERPVTSVDSPQRDFTLREAMHTPAFWLISLGHGSALLIVSVVNVHIVFHLTEGPGYSFSGAATVVALITAGQILGTLLGGIIGDRFDKRMIAVGCMLFHTLALLMVAHSALLGVVILFALLHGTAWGLRGPMMQAIRADYFGRTAYGAILGVSSLIITFGTISGPVAAGYLADRTGDYVFGFTVLALLSGLGSVFFLLAKRPALPAHAPVLEASKV